MLRSFLKCNNNRLTHMFLRSAFNKANDAADMKDDLAIEANLFENSAHVYKPAEVQKIRAQAKEAKINQSATKNTNRKQFITNNPAVKSVKKPIKSTAARHIDDVELGLHYDRLQLNDAILNKLMTAVRSRKRREPKSPIVIEGHRHIRDALQCNLRMQALIFSQREELAKISEQIAAVQLKHKIAMYKVPQHDLKVWSTLTTPPGLMAIFERPAVMPLAAANALPITVICDNIREPNNLGSIIRTCAALPCQQIVLTHGCCDPWESKALRGGCGGHYRLPIYDGVTWQELPKLFANYQNLCIFIGENNVEKLQAHKQEAIDYALSSPVGDCNIVIIGGESHGVSDEAYNFLKSMKKDFGTCLNIPVAEGVDSLNVASALTLIIYEIRKKILMKTE